MRFRGLVLSGAAALGVPLVWVGQFDSIASAQQPPALPPPFVQPPENLSGGPSDNPAEAAGELPLGTPYESLSAGISFRPPADCKSIGTISSKYIAEWSDPAHDWTLKLGRMTLDQPAPLVSGKNNFGKDTEGILNRTVKNLQASLPGSKILRQDVTNTRDAGRYDPKHPEFRDNVGLIAIRYTNEGRRRLSQQAIVQANDGVYYLITLTSPGSNANDDKAPDDPAEILAAQTFSRMLDTVRLLDRTAIRQDQEDRLFHSRSTILNWTPEKLHKIMLREQWVRIIKNGKDVGYSYITEEAAGGIPKPLTSKQMEDGKGKIHGPQDFKSSGDGVLIGVRARMTVDTLRSDKTVGPIQTDSASWFFVSADKKHEDFSRVVVVDDRKAPKKGYIQEFGVSEKRFRRIVERAKDEPNNGAVVVPDREVAVTFREDWELDVSQTSNYGAAEPLMRKLPTFYVGQVFSHLLPRLLPLDRPRGYLFATYISDAREVVLRYIDVMPEQTITFNGYTERAVPIRDRLGLEGAPTFHYMSIDGRYIGSENKEQKVVMVPTNAEMLTQIWKDANLTRPGGVERGGGANADAGTPH